MKRFITKTKKGSLYLLSIGLMLFASSFGSVVHAAETGGYPWADAVLIRASTYDWGYKVCQPAMIQAKTCSAHYAYKDGQRYHESDPWKYDVRNCTSFVSWKVHQTYQISISGWGDAKNWDTMALKLGYRVSTTPKQGDIALWNSGTYGHVAFVLSVNIDNSVNVEQYNKAGKGEYSKQSRVRAESYIHVAPIITPKPVIEVPTLPQPVIQPVIESLPFKPLPEEKLVVPTDTATLVPPATPIESSTKPIVKDQDVSYFVENVANSGIKAYAVKHKNTKSGKVEIHSSDVTKPDAAWSPEIITPEAVQLPRSTSYAIADYDGDGVNDMYQIVYGNTDSKMVEVSVLDGATNYATYKGKWTTSEQQHNADEVWYTVADSNGDNSLDLYQVWQDNTVDGLVHVSVLDGQKSYSTVLTSFVLPEATHNAQDVYFMVGDHNNDGVTDIYQVLHNKTNSGKVEIKVFSGNDPKGSVISKWVSDTALYQGVGPNLQDAVK